VTKVQRFLKRAKSFGRELISGFSASPFAKTITVSFVLMSPSTVMRLKLCATATSRQFLRIFVFNGRVGRDKAKHRGMQACGGTRAGAAHAGLNHARAFANAHRCERFYRQLQFDGDLFRARVTRHDGFGELIAGFLRRL
jgi:hypothetical protein